MTVSLAGRDAAASSTAASDGQLIASGAGYFFFISIEFFISL